MTKQKKLVHFENKDEKSEEKPVHKKEKHHSKFFRTEVTVNVTQEQKKDDGCTSCCLAFMNIFKK